jgi:hypothetical protein
MPRTENRLQLDEIVIEIGAKERKLNKLRSTLAVTAPWASDLLFLLSDLGIHVDQALLGGLDFCLGLCRRCF